MEQLADDAVALADHLDVGRFLVIGHSYGGFVAEERAVHHPDRAATIFEPEHGAVDGRRSERR